MDKSKQASLVYNKIAEDYEKVFSKPSEYIGEFLTLLPKNAKILDVGCGAGRDSGFMFSKGFEVIGIDLSKGMLGLARQRYPKIDFKQQDMRSLNFSPKSFEGIFASCSLIHLPKKDVSSLLRNFHEILKEEGILYLSLQKGKSEEIFINEPFKPEEKLFLNIISFSEIKELLFKNGFSIIKRYERKPKIKKELNYTKLYLITKK